MKKMSLLMVSVLLAIVIISCNNDPTDNNNDNRNEPETIIVNGATLDEKLRWISWNAKNYTTYIVEVDEDTTIDSYSFGGDLFGYNSSITNIIIKLLSNNGSTIKRQKNYDRSLFRIGKGVTLILDNINIIDTSPSYYVENYSWSLLYLEGGNLIINQGTNIYGIKKGDGIMVSAGSLTMNGGLISDFNRGIYLNYVIYTSGGTSLSTESYLKEFIMNGGVIKNEIHVRYGLFTLNNGEILDNSGVSIGEKGTFTMEGGKIYNNKRSGVSVDGKGSTFTMKGGEIFNNTTNTTSSYGGGGVRIGNDATFTMDSGKIYNNIINTSYSSLGIGGGGVYVSGVFNMGGGEIFSNTVSIQDNYINNSSRVGGGGVYVASGGILYKTGGTINGYIKDDINSNTVIINDIVEQNRGHAIYVGPSSYGNEKIKNTISDPSNNLFYINGEYSGEWD